MKRDGLGYESVDCARYRRSVEATGAPSETVRTFVLATSDFETFRSTKYFGSLDGLRCISILAVVWHHTGAIGHQDALLAQRGNYGVDLFFAISGFLITTLLLREYAKYGDISLRKFYMRRSLRIFPLYYTVVLVYVAAVALIEKGSPEGKAFFAHLAAYLTYTSNWFVDLTDARIIFYFAWSLATEEQFYLVWPSIEKYLAGWRAVLTMITTVALVLLVRSSVFADWLPSDALPHRIVTSVAFPICFGVLLAHALHDERTFRVAFKLIGSRWAGPVLLLLLILVLATAETPYVPASIVMALLVGACSIREDHALAPVFRWRPLAHIGTVSYGIYLMHMLARNAVELGGISAARWPWASFFATTLVATLAATISSRYYESFFLRFKTRFARL